MLNLRKKLLVSIFTLMLALVAVSTTTYAWFTLGNSAEVSGLQLEVQGAEGLTVRITEINTVTDLGDLSAWKINHSLTGKTDVLLAPLTLNDEGKLTALDGTVSTAAPKDSPYVQITFEFRSESAAKVQFLDLQALAVGNHNFNSPISVAAAGAQRYGTGAPVTTESADTDGNPYYLVSNARLANALRIAYKGEGETTWNVIDPVNYDAVMAKSDVAGYTSSHYGTWNGASKDYYEELTGKTLASKDEYNYVKQQNTNSKYLNTIDLVTLAEKSAADSVTYYTGSITLIVWLEGYDSDCFNAVISDSALLNFTFTAVSTKAESASE